MTLYNVIWQRSRNVSQTFSQRSHNVDLLAGYLFQSCATYYIHVLCIPFMYYLLHSCTTYSNHVLLISFMYYLFQSCMMLLTHITFNNSIFQEIIQNADDAGASEVRFLFDATSYGTSSLVSPGLACFQGPALYCYNNAVFTEEDWEGLQSLMRSKKKDNPLKVGRFGIGFNSVYHITGMK